LGYVKFTTDPLEWLRYIILPAFTLSLLIAAILARQLRASLVDVLDSNFVRAAWARGGTSSTVVTKHAMKNASIPAITVFGVQVGALLGGSVIVESIFSVPGLGPYFLTSIQQGDLPAIQAVTLVFVTCQILIALLVDLTYGVLNPRIRVH
jgi:peptide/nickel transport system permease protein